MKSLKEEAIEVLAHIEEHDRVPVHETKRLAEMAIEFYERHEDVITASTAKLMTLADDFAAAQENIENRLLRNQAG
jgi:hypothetical protein